MVLMQRNHSTLSDTEQYVYGLEAGRILRKIHSIPAPETQEDWEIRFNRKMDYKIKKYTECPLKYENGQAFIDYINESLYLLKDRPQTYQHGDYHIGNMMIGRTASCISLILTAMTMATRGRILKLSLGMSKPVRCLQARKNKRIF